MCFNSATLLDTKVVFDFDQEKLTGKVFFARRQGLINKKLKIKTITSTVMRRHVLTAKNSKTNAKTIGQHPQLGF